VDFIDGYCWYLDDTDYLRRPVLHYLRRITCAFWYRPEQIVANQWVCAWLEGSTVIAHLRVDPTSKNLRFYRGTSTPFSSGYTTDYPLMAGHRYKIYTLMEFNSFATSAWAWANGIDTVRNSQDPTDNTNAPDTFQLGGSGAVKAYYDNVILGSKILDERAPYHVFHRSPKGAGSSTQWTPSISPNWYASSPIPISATKYIATNTSDRIDLYAIDPLYHEHDFQPGWFQIQAAAVQWNFPTPTNANVCYRTGGVTTHGSDQAVTNAGLGNISSIWEFDDPDLPHGDFMDDIEIGLRSRA
jgi:hypothetical protein